MEGMAKACCKENVEASKDIMVSLSYKFCFKIHVENDGNNTAVDTLHFHVLCVLKNKTKDTYYFLHVFLKETVPSILMPGSNLLYDTIPEFVNMILYIAVK
jgi:hypothetical protein